MLYRISQLKDSYPKMNNNEPFYFREPGEHEYTLAVYMHASMKILIIARNINSFRDACYSSTQNLPHMNYKSTELVSHVPQ